MSVMRRSLFCQMKQTEIAVDAPSKAAKHMSQNARGGGIVSRQLASSEEAQTCRQLVQRRSMSPDRFAA